MFPPLADTQYPHKEEKQLARVYREADVVTCFVVPTVLLVF
jgi:hypothetical protein